jgi:hypothetical protein
LKSLPIGDLGCGKGIKVRRVLVVHTDLIFGRGLQGLLVDVAGLEVIGYDPRDQSDLLQAVRLTEPNDVLLTRGNLDLADVSTLLMFQRSDPKMRVIVMSPNDNLVHIYDSRQMQFSSSIELFPLVLGD